MKLVVDASVALKWYLGFHVNEQHVPKAIALGRLVEAAGTELFAPPHWVLEVISALARREPRLVNEALLELDGMSPVILSGQRLLRHAADIAISLDAHLFDTLYHAVALETGATLVTADERYFGKAAALGNIVRLVEFSA